MKKRNFFIYLFSILLNTQAIGQIDPVLNNDSIQHHSLGEKLNYLDVNFRQEKTLIKLGINPFQFLVFSDNSKSLYFNATITLEKKIIPSLSIYSDIRLNHSGGFDKWNIQQFSNSLGLHYYYTIEKRIRNSVGANNFHGNYFSFELKDWVNYRHYKMDNNRFDERWIFEPELLFSWGIHRRLGKWGFIGVGPYMGYSKAILADKKTLTFGFNFKLGLAYGW